MTQTRHKISKLFFSKFSAALNLREDVPEKGNAYTVGKQIGTVRVSWYPRALVKNTIRWMNYTPSRALYFVR